MSTVHGGPGNIVTSGLMLNLDAANPRSYPPPYNGTVWTDLSGNNKNGTLINGVSYSSLNGGSLTFDGTNDYVSVANTTIVLSNVNKFTIDSWFKLTNPALNNTIFSFGTADNYNNDILIGVYGSIIFTQVNNGADGSAYPIDSFTSTAWTNIQVVYDGTQTGNANRLKMYINRVLQTLTYSYTVPSTSGTNSGCGVGAYSTGGFNNFLNGNISQIKVYNRTLSASEISQNFNATRARFGI